MNAITIKKTDFKTMAVYDIFIERERVGEIIIAQDLKHHIDCPAFLAKKIFSECLADYCFGRDNHALDLPI